MRKKYVSFLLSMALIISATQESTALIKDIKIKNNVITKNINILNKKDKDNEKMNIAELKTYEVESTSKLKDVLNEIEESKDLEFLIMLKSNIDNKDNPFCGISKKHITVKSEEGKSYKLYISDLNGSCTFDNVSIETNDSELYANGNKVEFTENVTLSLGALYGGAKNGNVASTHIVMKGGNLGGSTKSHYSLVGGCEKGSVEGNVNIEISGKANVSNAMTGGNYSKNYTESYIGGDINILYDRAKNLNEEINVYSIPYINGTNNSKINGDLNIKFKSGYVKGIYPQEGSEAEKNRIGGSVNIKVGDPEYRNDNDKKVKLVGNYGIYGAGVYGEKPQGTKYEVGGDINITTYENVWGWANDGSDYHPQYGDPHGIVGAKDANVNGTININSEGSHIVNILGSENSNVKNVEIYTKNIEINDPISEEKSDSIKGIDNKSNISGNINIKVDGGQIGNIYSSMKNIKGNSIIELTGNPKIRNNIHGIKKLEPIKVDKSILKINNSEVEIPSIDYFTKVELINNSKVKTKIGQDIYNMNINTNSSFETDAQLCLKGNLNMDFGNLISNRNTYINNEINTENSKLVFNNYVALGYSYKDDSTHDKNVVTSNNDTYTFNNNSLIDKIYGNADITNSTWNVLVPTIISGNYKGTTNKLSLPAFVDKENYPDEKIPLEIVGEATGTTDVKLVDKTDITKEGKPIVGQNYINGLKTSEKVFRLANENAKPENLYFEKVADADTQNKANYDMWQVAEGDLLTLDYKFVSEDGKKLPDNILNDEPNDEVNHHKGDNINKDYADKKIKKTDIAVENGVWHFEGWAYKEDGKYHDLSKEPIKMEHNVELIGVWHFEPKSTGGGGGGTIVTPPTDPDRIEGNDRIETSVETSKDLYPNGTNAVVLANAERYTDVLTADPFAIQEKASALMTYKDKLPEKTLKEIERLGAKKIYISGGYDAVSKKVVDELANRGYEIFRFDGVDRYDTARKIAIKIREKGNTNAAELASGEDFPDALCMTPLAVKDHAPILLTKKDSIPKYTKQALAEWDIENIKIGGLDEAVSTEVEKQLKAGFSIDKNSKEDSKVYDGVKVVKRIGGEDRYETSAKLAAESYPDSKLGVYATGEDFPDALIAGNYAGRKEAPVLLVKGNDLPEPIEKYTKESKIEKATIIGGVNAVSDKVLNLIKAAINK